MFGVPFGDPSPFWHAIAREYLERWAHHSQIRRALGMDSLADPPFLEIGLDIVSTIAGAPTAERSPGVAEHFEVGPIVLGSREQAADILTLAHSADEVAALVSGPADAVEQFAAHLAALLHLVVEGGVLDGDAQLVGDGPRQGGVAQREG